MYLPLQKRDFTSCDAYLENFIPSCTQFHVDGDGNCLFSSVLHQLIPYKTNNNNNNNNFDFMRLSASENKKFKMLFLDWIEDCVKTDYFTNSQLIDFFPLTDLDQLTQKEIFGNITRKRKINEINNETNETKELNNIDFKQNILNYINRNRNSDVYADNIMIYLMSTFLQIPIQIIKYPRKNHGFEIVNYVKINNNPPILSYINNSNNNINMDDNNNNNNKYQSIISLIKQVDFTLERHLLIVYTGTHYNSIISNLKQLNIYHLQKIFKIIPFGIARDIRPTFYSTTATTYKIHKMLNPDESYDQLEPNDVMLIESFKNNFNDEDVLSTYINTSLYDHLKYKHIKLLIQKECLKPWIFDARLNYLQKHLRKTSSIELPHTLLLPTLFFKKLVESFTKESIDSMILSKQFYDNESFMQLIAIMNLYIYNSMCPKYTTIYQFDQICIPVYKKTHYNLIYMDLKTKTVIYYEPDKQLHNNLETKQKIQEYLTLLLKMFQLIWEYYYINISNIYTLSDFHHYEFSEWNIINKKTSIPLQQCKEDAGIVVLGYIESICFSELKQIQFLWKETDIKKLRYKIAADFIKKSFILPLIVQ